jgi:hypothetical protein
VRDNETAITIIALALGICLTLTLVFGNFSLAYFVKLFSEGRVPAGNTLFVFAVTAVNIGVLGFLTRLWLKSIRTEAKLESPPVNQQPQRQNNQQRWQAAREKIMELAQGNSGFTVQNVMEATTFNRSDSEYLLDELLHSDVLTVYQDAGEFKYTRKILSKVP